MNVNAALPDPKHNPYLAWTIGTFVSVHVEADFLRCSLLTSYPLIHSTTDVFHGYVLFFF